MTVDWNKLAIYYDRVSQLEAEYTPNQLDCLEISAGDTVLDIGCGPGRISVPAALRAKRVTALDAFDEMLALCARNAKLAGAGNISTVHLDWRDAVIGKNIQKHDIVIAARSVGLMDPRKLNAAADKCAVMIGWTPGWLPSVGSLFEGVAEDPTMKFSDEDDPIRRYIVGYQHAFNQVYEMGALPNVRIVQDGFSRRYSSRQEAYRDLAALQEFPPEKQLRFQQNVDGFLAREADGGVTYRCERQSYVLWWKPV